MSPIAVSSFGNPLPISRENGQNLLSAFPPLDFNEVFPQDLTNWQTSHKQNLGTVAHP